MITQGQFNRAMTEVNNAFKKQNKRIEALEEEVRTLSGEVEALQKPATKPKSTNSKENA
jgi:uncharacterized coiled-coil protein SlyX